MVTGSTGDDLQGTGFSEDRLAFFAGYRDSADARPGDLPGYWRWLPAARGSLSACSAIRAFIASIMFNLLSRASRSTGVPAASRTVTSLRALRHIALFQGINRRVTGNSASCRNDKMLTIPTPITRGLPERATTRRSLSLQSITTMPQAPSSLATAFCTASSRESLLLSLRLTR